ncbi:MAG: hypothetical protein LBN20_05415, partial [Endomicrobium sp.]|nr:hypothetical protein [Endomicrobium sp.]
MLIKQFNKNLIKSMLIALSLLFLCYVESNAARITWSAQTLTVTLSADTAYSDNSPSENGGGMALTNASNITIQGNYNLSLNNNKSYGTGFGGALFLSGNSRLTINL